MGTRHARELEPGDRVALGERWYDVMAVDAHQGGVRLTLQEGTILLPAFEMVRVW